MKGYIYITGTGADPALLGNLNDPLFDKVPTLGACMSNLREFLDPGDFIFVVSGKVPTEQQYIIGGMRVKEKLDALTAYGRFPENRLRIGSDGLLKGNIIVDEYGNKHPLDRHTDESFQRRIKNFIVGESPVSLQTKKEVELGRQRTLLKLSDMFDRPGNRAIDIMGRQRKLDDVQVAGLLDWLKNVKTDAKR